MQIGAQVSSYERINKHRSEKKVIKSTVNLKFIAYFISAIFISRVTMINNTAPFGVALALTMINHKKDRLPLAVGVGSFIGYMTLFNTIGELPLYLIMLAGITSINYGIKSLKVIQKVFISMIFMLGIMILYRYMINNYTLAVVLLTAIFHLACIFPIYFIMDYAIICSGEIKTKHLFKNEEIISMAIVLSLIISGTWGLDIFNVSFRNLLALFFIMIISYINGSAVGAATGVAMGVIVGVSSNNMINFISIYGVCGLIVGVFKETGKWLTALAYLVIFCILKLYSGISEDIKIIEGVITSGVFLLIPARIYDRWIVELDWERKQEIIGQDYIEKIKEVFEEKLKGFSSILNSTSTILNDLVDNDRLVMKQKSSSLIENLAEKVCGKCDMKNICWKREFHNTYIAFGELIQNYQENTYKIPRQLQEKCVKRTMLINCTEEIVNNYIISEMWRKRLSEGREILSGQVKNMANTIEEIVEDFNKEVSFNIELEKTLRRVLNKKSLKVNDILCYEDRNSRLHIKLTKEACGGKEKCIKQVLPLINEASGRLMCVGDEGCIVDSNTKRCTIWFEETPKFHVSSFVARESKEGEKFNGDSYSYGKLKDGTYMTILSDGMGSGPEAHRESKAAVELIEKFTEGGFSKETAINTVNSVMSIRCSEEDKFSTLDLNSIDLYSGEMTFMKVGAVASFIKSGDDVDVISSKTLPIGVLDKVDVDVTEKNIGNGDMIVTISDGIMDSIEGDWILSYLRKNNSNNPKDLATDIINKVKDLSGGKAKDDMTVIVSKVYNLY